ncbi:unnamed protein product [Sphagnum jensenii]
MNAPPEIGGRCAVESERQADERHSLIGCAILTSAPHSYHYSVAGRSGSGVKRRGRWCGDGSGGGGGGAGSGGRAAGGERMV